MTMNVSRRSLLAIGAGLGASTFLGGSAVAKAPKLGTQTPYWHRFILGDAEVTVVSDGTLPLGPPKTAQPPSPTPAQPARAFRKPERTVERPRVRTRPRFRREWFYDDDW